MSKKTELLKKAASKITEQVTKLASVNKENLALKQEIASLVGTIDKKDKEITGNHKLAAATDLAESLVSKGSLRREDMKVKIAEILVAADGIDDIKKMATMYDGLQHVIINDGELVGDSDLMPKTAEEQFFVDINK